MSSGIANQFRFSGAANPRTIMILRVAWQWQQRWVDWVYAKTQIRCKFGRNSMCLRYRNCWIGAKQKITADFPLQRKKSTLVVHPQRKTDWRKEMKSRSLQTKENSSEDIYGNMKRHTRRLGPPFESTGLCFQDNLVTLRRFTSNKCSRGFSYKYFPFSAFRGSSRGSKIKDLSLRLTSNCYVNCSLANLCC